MEYAIETIGLVKRYPTSAALRRGSGSRRFGGGRGGGTWGRAEPVSPGAIIRALRGIKGASVEALRGVDLKIKEGEIFGVLGPNGAGKTTLIKILCTLVIHDEGEAYVYGFDVRKQPGNVLNNLQAVLPESRGFAWRLTGAQNLMFFSMLYGLTRKQSVERVNYLLNFTGLTERANDGYQRYSTGMQRRLLLCRAMLRDSSILLFDEPTAGLDPVSAAEFRGMLKRLAKEEKKTIFLSTHNLTEAQDICDRIAILDRGKIIACDTPHNIRYMMLDEKVFNITLIDAVFSDHHVEMISQLEKVQGVLGVSAEVDPEWNFNKLSIRTHKDLDISSILEMIIKSGLKIGMISAKEPTLEQAFMTITGQRQKQPGQISRYRRGS